jgi:translation initiation factor 3 subunit C
VLGALSLGAHKSHIFNFDFRLKDEKIVASIIDKVQEYLERQSLSAELCRIYLRKIEHLYYKFDPDVLKQKKVSFLNSCTSTRHESAMHLEV